MKKGNLVTVKDARNYKHILTVGMVGEVIDLDNRFVVVKFNHSKFKFVFGKHQVELTSK